MAVSPGYRASSQRNQAPCVIIPLTQFLANVYPMHTRDRAVLIIFFSLQVAIDKVIPTMSNARFGF